MYLFAAPMLHDLAKLQHALHTRTSNIRSIHIQFGDNNFRKEAITIYIVQGTTLILLLLFRAQED